MGKENEVKDLEVATEQVPEKTASFDQIVMIAGKLFRSGLFTHLKKPEQAVAVVEYGRELGVPPMQSLQMMAVISGKIAIQSQLLLAIAKRNGCDVEITKQTKEECVIKFKREGKVYPVSFTYQEAEDLGLTGKDNWQKQTANMLYWRCISKAIRRHAPDLMLGIYTIEELTAGDKTTVEEIQEGTEMQDIQPTQPAQSPQSPQLPKTTGKGITAKQEDKLQQIRKSHLITEDEKVEIQKIIGQKDGIKASEKIKDWFGEDWKGGERQRREYIELYVKSATQEMGEPQGELVNNFRKEAENNIVGLKADQVAILIKELKDERG